MMCNNRCKQPIDTYSLYHRKAANPVTRRDVSNMSTRSTAATEPDPNSTSEVVE